MQHRLLSVRARLAKTLTIMVAATAVLGITVGPTASLASSGAHASKKRHKSHKKKSNCRPRHKDLDKDGKDRRCPDDRDGPTV